VQLLHALPIDDLRALYTIAEACIYPSTKEWFGYPPYEALFCGTKVLTTQAIDLKRAPWIYIVDDFYDVEKYKIGLNILLKETLVFKDKDIYMEENFKKAFLDFLAKS
jgi:glycosyltransferase involved in cell wall biosynthesis